MPNILCLTRSFAFAVASLAILLSAPQQLSAQTTGLARLFISTSPTTPTLETPTIHVRAGDTVTLYLWWKRQAASGVSAVAHDVSLSEGILTRTNYQIDNPSINGIQRWSDPTNSGGTSATLPVDDANALRIGGSNLGFDTTSDSTYDTTSDSYRFSTLTLSATGTGRTELRIGVGSQGIAFTNQPPESLINFGFGDDAIRGDSSARTTSTAVTALADAIVYVAAADKPWLNPALALDVNADGEVTPLDALLIINELNQNGSHNLEVPPPGGAVPPYFDPDGDNIFRPLDALVIINHLNDDGQSSAFVVSSASAAVPEPSSNALALLALVALAITSIVVRSKYPQR